MTNKRPTRSNVTLNRSELLREGERQPTSLALPVAVHHRLDRLAELVAGTTKTTRGEIIAMLIADAPFDDVELEGKIMAYRRKRVEDVLPEFAEGGDQEGKDAVVVQMRGPGRPATG